MPEITGLEVLRELRKSGNDIPVILITAYGSVERAVEVVKAGAYDFITRPFDPDHIELVVRRRSSARRSSGKSKFSRKRAATVTT